MLEYFTFPTTLGDITAFADEGKLVALTHMADPQGAKEYFLKDVRAVTSPEQHPLFKQLHPQLEAYLAGKAESFHLPIDPQGTPFQQQLWQALREIPYGQQVSYSSLARHIGRPKAVRAVGSACAANPLPLITPCHRVIRHDGTLGGFRWGLPIKQQLLNLEKRKLPKLA
jgi:O-6-methylguanine DNA methyltransferase